MISGTYIGSALVLAVLTILFVGDSLGTWGFMALLLATFFLASAGASSAYLTVSEIFPMETRALAIAFFYAIGTAIGGITGPVPVREDDRERRGVAGRDRVLHRRRRDGARRHRGDLLRRQGRAGRARGHRQAADRDRTPSRTSAPTRRWPSAPRRSRDAARPPTARQARRYRLGPGPHRLLARHVGLRADHRAGVLPRGRGGSSRRWPSTARPSGASSRGSSAPASGARAGSRRRCARRSSGRARRVDRTHFGPAA